MTLLHMKRFKHAALLSLLVSTQIRPFPSAGELAKDHGMKVLYLALLGGTTYYKSSIQHGVRGIPEAFNINKKDFTAALQLFFAGSFAGEFAKGTVIQSMTKAALLAHLFGVLITSSEWYNKQLGRVPVTGDILTCQDADCKGACNACKLRKLLPAEAVAQLTILATKKLNEWRKANQQPVNNNANNQAGNDANVNNQAGNDANVNNQAGNDANVNNQAGNDANANNQAGNDANINNQAGDDANVNNQAGNDANVNNQAGNDANVNNQAGNDANANNQAGNDANINNQAGDESDDESSDNEQEQEDPTLAQQIWRGFTGLFY